MLYVTIVRVVANVKFSYVLEKIKPLEREQQKLQTNLKMAEDQIGQLSSGLDEVDQQVENIRPGTNVIILKVFSPKIRGIKNDKLRLAIKKCHICPDAASLSMGCEIQKFSVQKTYFLVVVKVAILKERLNKFTKEAAEIEIHLRKTKETITAADSLVIGLEGEYERWNKEVAAF
jgi:predicted nuclease with TOPRIM domain